MNPNFNASPLESELDPKLNPEESGMPTELLEDFNALVKAGEVISSETSNVNRKVLAAVKSGNKTEIGNAMKLFEDNIAKNKNHNKKMDDLMQKMGIKRPPQF